jgi:chromosome segregation ATPase
MHIKNVEITGFKSYGSRKLVELDPGINVIVGKNGKGKSNVYDGERHREAGRGSKNALLGGALCTASRLDCAALV